MNEFHVCIVDDEPMARTIAGDALRTRSYRVTECCSGESCLAMFSLPAKSPDFDQPDNARPPDLVLLDIEMPEMDGYEVCRQLRAAGYATQVIFVSGRDDLESRLEGFDAGGTDFLVKPYALTELYHHVQKFQDQALLRKDQAEQLSFAQKTAFAAMSSMGEMGTVLHFMRESFGCETSAALGDKLLSTLQAYQLDGLVRLRLGESETFRSIRGECTELEISILDYLRSFPRCQQIGERLVLNYADLSLVVLNLPTHEPDRLERLRDHLSIVMEGAAARLQSLEIEHRRGAQTHGILMAISALSATFAGIERKQADNRRIAQDVATNFNERLFYAFLGMGLSENQEKSIAQLADEAMERILVALDGQAELGSLLKETTLALRRLVADESQIASVSNENPGT